MDRISHKISLDMLGTMLGDGRLSPEGRLMWQKMLDLQELCGCVDE